MSVTKVKWNRFWSNFRELTLLNISSLEMNVLLFLLFSRLNMDRLSFVLSLLFIVSVTTTFGSVIKAKNPNGEVKETYLCYCLWSKVLLVVLESLSWNFHGIFVLFTPRIVTSAWQNVPAHDMLQQMSLLFRIWHSMLKPALCKNLKYSRLHVYMWNFSHLLKVAGKRSTHG